MSASPRVCIVTGAASGIGRALAAALVRRGGVVVLADIDREGASEVARELGSRAVAAPLDVTRADDVQALVDDTLAAHGRLDAMFNNAGICVVAEETDATLAHWDRVLDVNLRGVVHGVKAAYPVMVRQRSGHIVNTASLAGLMPAPGIVSYCASKHAVVGLSRSLRVEAADHGVRVSVVCPGWIDTALPRRMEVVGFDRDDLTASLPLSPCPPDECARQILRGVDRNDGVIVVTRHARALAGLQRLAPRLLERLMLRQVRAGRSRRRAT